MLSGPFRALFVLGLVGAVVGIFFGAKGALSAKHAVDSVNRKGGDDKSMFRAQRLDAGLDKVRAEIGADGQLLGLNVYPGYIQVDASTGSEDKGRSFRIQDDGKVDELPVTLTGPGRLKDNVFPIEDVDTKLVERLANEAAGKERLDGLDDVTHIAISIQPDNGQPGIAVYLNNSKFWRASLDGKSGLTSPEKQARAVMDGLEQVADETPAKPAAAEPAATAAPAADGATDLQDCVSAAGTNVAKLSACTK